MLAGLMPQGSVLPLDLIGSEGARVFRKNMLRYDDPFRKNKIVAISGVFMFLGTRIGPMLVSRAGCPGRSAFVDGLGQRFFGLGFFRLPHLRALLPSSHRSASCTAVS